MDWTGLDWTGLKLIIAVLSDTGGGGASPTLCFARP